MLARKLPFVACGNLGPMSNEPKASFASVASTRSAKLPGRRPGLALALNVIALVGYAFGLIAPLTPSHGFPSWWLLLVFISGPISLLAAASRLCQLLAARIFATSKSS